MKRLRIIRISITRIQQNLYFVYILYAQEPGDAQDISLYEGNNSINDASTNMHSPLTENSSHNGVSPVIDTNGTKWDTNGYKRYPGVEASSDTDFDHSEKLALIEELVQTWRDTFERMPTHLLQYELAKAKAMSIVKFP